jgi:hypothetical protein
MQDKSSTITEPPIKASKTSLYWVSIAFFLMVTVVYVLYWFKVSQASPINYIGYLPFITCLGLTIQNHKSDDGYLSFGKAFTTGFKFVSGLSVLMGFFTLIYLRFLNTEVFEQGLVEAKNQMDKEGKTIAQINLAIETAKAWGPFMAGITTTFMYTFTGAIITLFFSVILKKNSTQQA